MNSYEKAIYEATFAYSSLELETEGDYSYNYDATNARRDYLYM